MGAVTDFQIATGLGGNLNGVVAPVDNGRIVPMKAGNEPFANAGSGGLSFHHIEVYNLQRCDDFPPFPSESHQAKSGACDASAHPTQGCHFVPVNCKVEVVICVFDQAVPTVQTQAASPNRVGHHPGFRKKLQHEACFRFFLVFA